MYLFKLWNIFGTLMRVGLPKNIGAKRKEATFLSEANISSTYVWSLLLLAFLIDNCISDLRFHYDMIRLLFQTFPPYTMHAIKKHSENARRSDQNKTTKSYNSIIRCRSSPTSLDALSLFSNTTYTSHCMTWTTHCHCTLCCCNMCWYTLGQLTLEHCLLKFH